MSSRRKLLWAAVSLALLLAIVSVVDGRGFRRYFRMQQDLETLRTRNRQTAADNRALVQEIEALRTDPAALERAAREELGFVKPDEAVINLE